ncbi:MAG: GNAT family N-acetyltransferase [Pseudomonadota bacterium]
MKRKSLEKIIGPPEERVPLIGARIRRARIAAVVLDGEVVGHLSYRMDGRGAVWPDWPRYRARFGLIGGAARYVATELTLRRGRRQDLYIESFAVDRAARGRGIGGALLTWLCEEVALHGKLAWRTELPEANLPAKRVYEKLGARHVRSVAFGPVARLLHTPRVLLYRWVHPGKEN